MSGLADVNITELLSFHQRHGKWATVILYSAWKYGALDCEGKLRGFVEKPKEIVALSMVGFCSKANVVN